MPEEQIKALQHAMEELTKELTELMQGSTKRDSKGIFARLREVEQAARDCENFHREQIESLRNYFNEEVVKLKAGIARDFQDFEKEQEQSFNLIHTSVDKISTALSQLTMEINKWKGVVDVVQSKWFWWILAFIASGRFIYWIVEAVKAANK